MSQELVFYANPMSRGRCLLRFANRPGIAVRHDRSAQVVQRIFRPQPAARLYAKEIDDAPMPSQDYAIQPCLSAARVFVDPV